MIFKCKNCGGNVVYSPEKGDMYCPFCDSEKSEERTDESLGELTICPNCGGEVAVKEHTAATQCPSCDCYLIFNERVEGKYAPKTIIPFRLGKETCKKSLRDKFHKFRFAPTDFLSEARMNSMQGVYVPFWFYDYDAHWDFQAEGTKIREWTSGDTAYKETSVYDIRRDMDIRFRKIPVDASEEMPDDVMDLVEPFDYAQMVDFMPEYMSGFSAEKYNMASDAVEERAHKKMNDDAKALLDSSYSGYASVNVMRQNLQLRDSSADYGLLPVWKYIYRYNEKDYPFYVNGQTGKIVGNPPISKKKVWVYTGTLWACMTAVLALIQLIAIYII